MENGVGRVAGISEYKYFLGENQCNLQEGCGSCAGHWYLQWQKLLGSSTKQITGNPRHSHTVADSGLPDFLPCSQLALYVSVLLASGWGETEASPLCSALKGWGNWLVTSLFCFQ